MLHILASAPFPDARAESQAIEFLSYLRNYDVNFDDVNPKTGLTPLHRAVMSDNRIFALALIDQGASATLTTAKERRSPADIARDDSFRQELLSRGKAAAAAATKITAPPATPAPGPSAPSGPVHKIIATPDAPLAALALAARGAFASAAQNAIPYVGAPVPAGDDPAGPQRALTAASNPVLLPDAALPQPRADVEEGARRLRRRLVVPEPSAAASLREAWWRVRDRLPPAPAPLPRTDAVAQLAFRGIPPELRADLWLAAAGVPAVMATMEARGISYKRLIGVSCSHLSKECIVQIEKVWVGGSQGSCSRFDSPLNPGGRPARASPRRTSAAAVSPWTTPRAPPRRSGGCSSPSPRSTRPPTTASR